MIKNFRAAILLGATVGALGVTSIVASGAGAATTSVTASTNVTSRDDSGTNSNGTTSNWAVDNFTRKATIFFHGLATQNHCPGIGAGLSCYYWTGLIKDSGNFTTVVGDAVPGKGSLNTGTAPLIYTAVKGGMSGKFSYAFYTDQNASSASATNMPPTITGDSPATGNWVEQFFNTGVHFWDTSGNTGGSEYLGTTGSWTYTASFGSDAACPNLASRWVDASPDWGTSPADGNILAPDTAHC
jgi:hypothetical protein